MVDLLSRLSFQDREIILIGTAHMSKESVDLVGRVIEEERPETVCVELCRSRYESITEKRRWEETDLLKVIKEKKAFLLLSNLMLASFQRKMGRKLGIKPGGEIIRAIEAARQVGARIHLADRDIRITLSRTWRVMGLWAKAKLLAQLLTSIGQMDGFDQEEIEKLKRRDVLETLLAEIGETFPAIKGTLIDERDQYLAYRIRTAPGKRIVAVVGAGHVPGVQKYWERPVDIEALNQIPHRGVLWVFLKWGIPALVVGLILAGFLTAGKAGSRDLIKWWIAANGLLAGLGAAAAMGHPLTILSAFVAAPLTSLNPMIAAGWVSGLVETLLSKPKVRDFEGLPEDISSVKGFWKNRITRILLVVVFTNIGSSLGTFVAIPLMLRVLA
ncbi:MAG: TraB/GumN family protein [Deltaproteobacteria bacterium]|nr:TraB/GumN family protein [Deltaproteobacteria bacterium]